MSEHKHNPSEIAREALKRLAARHLAPTPANYQACYNEIAQLPNVVPFPEPPLRQLAARLPAHTPAQTRQLELLDQAIARRSWQGVQEALVNFCTPDAVAPHAELVALSPSAIPLEFARRLARFVESVLPALGDDHERLTLQAGDLLVALSQPTLSPGEIQNGLMRLTQVVSMAAEEEHEIKHALLRLLHLIVENIGELSLDDSWLKGQVDGLLAVAEPPITLRHLDEMERRLREVMRKQSVAKKRAIEAQEAVRQMLATFVERLAGIHQSSSDFQGRIEDSARRIEQVRHIEELPPLLGEVIGATRAMAEETERSRGELKNLQDKVHLAEAELAQLHLELDNASALARHDPLTDALNRKGLDEALGREIANMRRSGRPLSLCLLDLDNFKRLNDRLGHTTGDRALIHLSNVARSSMRTTDSLARYGGEEFVILMPDTSLDQGVETMVRLQRALTKAIFLADREKVLITFSAGVAQIGTGEAAEDAIARADRAMYLAKRAGKNRVMAG